MIDYYLPVIFYLPIYLYTNILVCTNNFVDTFYLLYANNLHTMYIHLSNPIWKGLYTLQTIMFDGVNMNMVKHEMIQRKKELIRQKNDITLSNIEMRFIKWKIRILNDAIKEFWA